VAEEQSVPTPGQRLLVRLATNRGYGYDERSTRRRQEILRKVISEPAQLC
jgi:hypothetical protein